VSVIQALILGIVQGATEFIPISSSGHLVLVPWLLNWPEPGLVFDAIVHWGTLLAIMAVFWHDVLALAKAWVRSLLERNLDQPEARLAWLIAVGTVPGALIGFLGEEFFESLFSSAGWVAGLLLVTGCILALSERLGERKRSMADLGWVDSILIGVAQGLAVAPGISRSGATIAMGLLRGVQRETAARYSFLLSTPIVLGAGLLQLVHLFQAGGEGAPWASVLLGFLAAAISGYVCIKFLLAYLQRGRLYVFATYCWLAGGLCLIVLLMRG
jgi:undecaprenyl-diphosphatase